MTHSAGAIEEQLRQAVLGRQYSELPQLAVAYREAVEAWVRSVPADDPRIPEVASRAREVLHGAIAQVRFERDILASQLAQVPNLRSFLRAPSGPGVRFDG